MRRTETIKIIDIIKSKKKPVNDQAKQQRDCPPAFFDKNRNVQSICISGTRFTEFWTRKCYLWPKVRKIDMIYHKRPYHFSVEVRAKVTGELKIARKSSLLKNWVYFFSCQGCEKEKGLDILIHFEKDDQLEI